MSSKNIAIIKSFDLLNDYKVKKIVLYEIRVLKLTRRQKQNANNVLKSKAG